jgi:BA14K-like protein
MTRFSVLGASALSLSLAIATPVLAQQAHQGGHPGARANAGAARISGPATGVRSNVRGAQANFQPNAGRTGFSGRGNAQFAEGDRGVLGGGQFRGGRDRGFGRDAGIAAGVATGAAIAAGDYGYGYADPYYGDNYAYDPNDYGDSYAYDTGVTFSAGLPLVTFNQPAPIVEGPVAVTAGASYCAQRYRSYDPASGTYLGYDGLRHPCM